MRGLATSSPLICGSERRLSHLFHAADDTLNAFDATHVAVEALTVKHSASSLEWGHKSPLSHSCAPFQIRKNRTSTACTTRNFLAEFHCDYIRGG